jgi:hypothetical protein
MLLRQLWLRPWLYNMEESKVWGGGRGEEERLGAAMGHRSGCFNTPHKPVWSARVSSQLSVCTRMQHVVAVNPTSASVEAAPILCILSTTKMHEGIKPDLSLFSSKWASGRQLHCAKWNFTSFFYTFFPSPFPLSSQIRQPTAYCMV